MSLITDNIRVRAEIHYGNDICQERIKFILEQMGLPTGLLHLKELEECGYVPETGFIWMKQKNNTVHKFEKIGKVISYGSLITAYIKRKMMKNLTGVKSKELIFWIDIIELFFDPVTKNITVKTPTGFLITYPASAFDEEVKKAANIPEKVKKV